VIFALQPGQNWRFRIPASESIAFTDGRLGPQIAVSGRDFGDFLVWRKDGVPSYQLACAVDDALMQITEVVRGEDLITSTFRQILLFRALGYETPAFHHCPLLTDSEGKRMAKRDGALSIQALRTRGYSPEEVRAFVLERLPA
jgi:glutamyl-tRNA synthetase